MKDLPVKQYSVYCHLHNHISLDILYANKKKLQNLYQHIMHHNTLSNWPILNFINLRHTKLSICILLLDEDDRNQSFSSLAYLWVTHVTKPTHHFNLNKTKKLKTSVSSSINTLRLMPKSFCDFCKKFEWD